MCGIVGFTSFHHPVPDRQAVIRRMMNSLEHRGPDECGIFMDDRIALGHRRLSIIDLETGTQPMSVEDGTYTIVFNGEVYNYLELRRDLEVAGRRFATRSDTEVVLHQVAVDGMEALTKLNGMFAFAVWNSRKQQLFLARDRMGEKPLFYTIFRGELVFASEMKALLLFPEIDRQINLLSVAKYLTFGFVPAPNTVYRSIYKLDPGACAFFDQRGMNKSTYWDIPLQDHPVSALNFYESQERIVSLLRSSVKQRLRSDVPVGVFLSGGIDSSVVTVLAAAESPPPLQTFSIGFEEASYDESPFAQRVSSLCGTEHHHELLSIRRACDIMTEIPRLMDEPFADASVIPTYLLSQLARKHLKVVLGGDGSDELFLGYPSFIAHRITEALSFLRISWRDALNRLVRKLPVSYSYASADFLLQQYLKGVGISADARFLVWMGFCGHEQLNRILSKDVQQALLYEDPFEDVVRHAGRSHLTDDFQRIAYLCMKMYLQDDILVKVDRASMAHGLEVRSPFLDHHLVEFACRILPKYKLNGLTTKYILKKAVRRLLPREIIDRRKAGFMMPVAKWLMTDMRPLLEEVCSDAQRGADGLFDAKEIRRLVEEHANRVRDHRKVLWALLCFHIWKSSSMSSTGPAV